MVVYSDFMDTIADKLKEDRNLSEPSIKLYISQLVRLNDDKSFKNLSFLKDVEDIMSKLEKYKTNTKKSYLSAIEAVLYLYKKKNVKLYDDYKTRLDEMKKEYNETNKNEINDKEDKNWIKWDEIMEIKKGLLDKVKDIEKKKILGNKDFNNLLKAFVLALYTDIPPRRNQDYLLCYITDKNKTPTENENYLVISENKFIFHKYKTSRKTGVQEVDFNNNNDFKYILGVYLKFHPIYKKNKKAPLLVDSNGSQFKFVNSITRLLNSIFKKKIGASMLRKIYLTHKFGDKLDMIKEMRELASQMGHSVLAQQNNYIKDDKEDKEDKEVKNVKTKK